MIQTLQRIFKLGSITIDDPNPNFSIKEVQEFYSGKYPELINASIPSPIYEGEQAIYEFKTNLGKKG